MSSTTAPERVYPAEFGGYGKKAGLPAEDIGGLKDVSFVSRYPTDLSPSVRILAICGITDHRNDAAPDRNGWFLSDFYLFHHLFKGVGAHQIWLTSEDPEELIDKYGPYIHGNPFEERREVLNKDLVDEITKSNNLRVVLRRDLCERFISTIRSEIAIALKNQQPLLLMVFGHGEEDTHSILLGWKSGSPEKFKISEMTKLLDIRSDGRAPEISLLTTACYSGGWAMVPHLSLTTMTAAGPEIESMSWEGSKSLGRYCGSIYATTVAKSLIKLEATSPGEPPATYAGFCNIIHTTLCSDVDRKGARHQIKFSAQFDAWETEWRTRSGIPLQSFKERWEMLPCIKSQDNSMTNLDPAGYKNAEEFRVGLRGGMGTTCARLNIEVSLRSAASEYLDSNPGPSCQSGNHSLHTFLQKVLKYQYFKLEELRQFQSQVRYRLSTIRLATSCKDLLKISFPDCAQFDMDDWYTKATVEAAGSDEGVRSRAKERLKRWTVVYGLVKAAHIFPEAEINVQGWPYPKPKKYLAVAISECSVPYSFENHVRKLEEGKVSFCNWTYGRFILISCSERHVDTILLIYSSRKAVVFAV